MKLSCDRHATFENLQSIVTVRGVRTHRTVVDYRPPCTFQVIFRHAIIINFSYNLRTSRNFLQEQDLTCSSSGQATVSHSAASRSICAANDVSYHLTTSGSDIAPYY
jgi:hypothetical protein